MNRRDQTRREPSNHRTLVSRFAASTAILAAALTLLALFFFVAIFDDFFDTTLRSMHRGFSASMAEAIWTDLDLAQRVAQTHGVGILITTPQGKMAYGPDGQPIDPHSPILRQPELQRIDLTAPDGRTLSFFWNLGDFVRQLLPLALVLIALLLMMVGGTYVFQVVQLRPLGWLRTGVDAVSRGDFTTRVPVVRNDEIGRVAQSFNLMTDRVQTMMRDRERLLGDVSHELRSPLARIKVALELMPEGAKRDLIDRDVREMEALTNVLLERERVRSRIDRLGSDQLPLIDLGTVVDGVVSGIETPVRWTAPSAAIELRGDESLLSILIHNLLDNAIKFSFADSLPVEVAVRRDFESIQIEVLDDGRGIPPAELERVFEPFVKLDPARGHRRGYGLGLNLCQRIVEAHGGRIRISNRQQRGTSVLVEFDHYPAASDASR